MRRHQQNIERIVAVARQLGEMEDFIAVLDGRLEIVEDILMSDKKIKGYLADHCKQLLENDEFLDALPAHLPPDQANQQRVSIIEGRMSLIAEMQ